MHRGVQKSGEQGFLPTPLVAQWLASASAHRRCKSTCPASRCHAVSKLRLLLLIERNPDTELSNLGSRAVGVSVEPPRGARTLVLGGVPFWHFVFMEGFFSGGKPRGKLLLYIMPFLSLMWGLWRI